MRASIVKLTERTQESGVMTIRSFVLTLLGVGLVSSPAFALSLNCDGGESPTPVEGNLQDILDDLVVSGPPIDAGSPSPFELFVAGSTGITAQVITAVDHLYFGIYPGGDVDNRVVLLHSDDPTSFVRAVSFTDQGTIVLGNEVRSGFDGPFGFFVKNSATDPLVFVYTEDLLNGGAQRALAFQGNGETVIQIPGLQAGTFRPDQFILAFDVDGDGQFADMIVAIAGIETGAAPEPAAALLMGLSLLALVRLRRS
jgi:hypothetical protein